LFGEEGVFGAGGGAGPVGTFQDKGDEYAEFTPPTVARTAK
jgi:hypothetical protein